MNESDNPGLRDRIQELRQRARERVNALAASIGEAEVLAYRKMDELTFFLDGLDRRLRNTPEKSRERERLLAIHHAVGFAVVRLARLLQQWEQEVDE